NAKRADRNQRRKGADTADRAGDADPNARARSVSISISGHGQVDDAPCRPPQHPRDKEQHEAAQQAVGEGRDRARGTRRRGQHIRAIAARERSDPSIAENANDAIDRQQHADHQRIAAERRRIERKHDVNDRIAEPDDAEARSRDNRASIALLRWFCHHTDNLVIASEAKQSTCPLVAPWIASSLSLLAMTKKDYAEIALADCTSLRSRNFWILPVDVFGITPNTTAFGVLKPDMC